MTQSAQRIDRSESELRAVVPSRRLSFLRFFQRYPIFLLAFGPPIFKEALVGVDTSQAHLDLWNVFQVAWVSVVALRAILRLTTKRSLFIPKEIRSILKLSIFLGLLFLISITYSPGRVVSAEYCVLYFLNLACIIEFIVDVRQHPPNWMQCIFQLRTIALILIAAVYITLAFDPLLVIGGGSGTGIRIFGGPVASMVLYPEMVAIISAYSFLYSLESRVRSTLFFLVGLGATLGAQFRGAELSLIIVLAVLVIVWAKMKKRSALILCSGLMVSALIAGIVVQVVGIDRVWKVFNRGQDTEGIITASGRTGVWADLTEYCLKHPEGMGYIAGVRTYHRSDYASNLHASLTNKGGTDNSYFQALTDAGWLALLLYLSMLAKTIALGWNNAKKYPISKSMPDKMAQLPFQCALLLLLYCLLCGMDASLFVTPLLGPFYCQNILIAIILGASATTIVNSRPGYPSLTA